MAGCRGSAAAPKRGAHSGWRPARGRLCLDDERRRASPKRTVRWHRDWRRHIPSAATAHMHSSRRHSCREVTTGQSALCGGTGTELRLPLDPRSIHPRKKARRSAARIEQTVRAARTRRRHLASRPRPWLATGHRAQGCMVARPAAAAPTAAGVGRLAKVQCPRPWRWLDAPAAVRVATQPRPRLATGAAGAYRCGPVMAAAAARCTAPHSVRRQTTPTTDQHAEGQPWRRCGAARGCPRTASGRPTSAALR
mmetsp:Transcript_32116/g.82239  ORF Transcript_32116/g.82239 Transcript_32116/m.82239 type:complete len:252 (+) Transcript_32116:672-1427(+)